MLKKYLQHFSSLLIVFGLFSSIAYAQGQNYRIQPEDVLKITVYEHDDLETTARVSSTGEISFPLLEKVNVSGLTVREVEDMLRHDLEQDYLVNAHVQVFIENYHTKQVTVLGAVNKPGKYAMNTEKGTTVLEAIALAGGFTNVANVNGTRVVRTLDDEEQSLPIRVTDITKKGMKEKDIQIRAGDIIFVPESFF